MSIVIFACILLSLLFAPLGAILTWQRKAYFSDGLTHACVLASSISGCFKIPLIISSPIVATIFALLVVFTKSTLANSAAINLISSSMLALGLLLASILPYDINISALLFGDILLVSSTDLIVLSIITILIYLVLFIKIDHIVIISLNSDLAITMGIKTKIYEIVFLVLLSLVLSISVKIVGALLVTALLMIPSYSATLLSKNPIQMICYSFAISLVSCICGIVVSFCYDVTTAPAIVLGCSSVYFIILLYRKILAQ